MDQLSDGVAGFDPFDPTYLADPHRILARVRADAPVFRYDPLDLWVVTRYATIRDIFRDPSRFSATVASAPLRPWCPEAQAIIAAGDVRIPPLLVNNDPPDHQIHRRFLGAPFARRRIAALAPMVRELVADQLRPRSADPRFDLVRDVTWEIPVHVLFAFLGVPQSDVATLKQWTASRVRLVWGHPEPAEQMALAHNLVDYARYSRQFVAAKEQDPGDDYTSDLLRAMPGEGRPHDELRDQIAINVFNLLFAGHETTSNMMTNAVRLVLDDPVAWSQLKQDPGAADAFAEEAIRLEPSVVAWRRRTTTDVVLDGVTVPSGSVLLLMLAAANRDPEQFPDPDQLDPQRANSRDHLSFGFGIHYCLGAQLARMQIAELLGQLASGFPSLRLVADQELSFVPNTSFRGPEHLLVQHDEPPAT